MSVIATRSLQRVHTVTTASGEARLIAAVIGLAASDAANGDDDAWRWLHTEALAWLSWICPDDVDAEDVLAALLRAMNRRSMG